MSILEGTLAVTTFLSLLAFLWSQKELRRKTFTIEEIINAQIQGEIKGLTQAMGTLISVGKAHGGSMPMKMLEERLEANISRLEELAKR